MDSQNLVLVDENIDRKEIDRLLNSQIPFLQSTTEKKILTEPLGSLIQRSRRYVTRTDIAIPALDVAASGYVQEPQISTTMPPIERRYSGETEYPILNDHDSSAKPPNQAALIPDTTMTNENHEELDNDDQLLFQVTMEEQVKSLNVDREQNSSEGTLKLDEAIQHMRTRSLPQTLIHDSPIKSAIAHSEAPSHLKIVLVIKGNKIWSTKVDRKRKSNEMNDEKSPGRKKRRVEENDSEVDEKENSVVYGYLQVSSAESAPAKKGIVDISKLSATLISATGGPSKSWVCPTWIANRLNACNWTDSELIKELNKLRGQFLRRNSGPKKVARFPFTETEEKVMLKIAGTEMAKIRCIGGFPEHMKIAYARMTRKFNEQVVGKTAAKGEAYAVSCRASIRNEDGSQTNARQKSKVMRPYKYTARTELAIKTMCQHLPRVKAIINRTDESYVLGGDSDSENPGDNSDRDSDSNDTGDVEVLGRYTDLGNELGRPYTETEVAVLLKEVKKEVANVRCIRRCIGLEPEPLDIALARVTANFNQKLIGKTAGKGEHFAETKKSQQKSEVSESNSTALETTDILVHYPYEFCLQSSIESICRRIPALMAVLDEDLVTILEVDSDSDNEDLSYW